MKHLEKPKVFPRDILAILILLIAVCAYLYFYAGNSCGAEFWRPVIGGGLRQAVRP